MKKYHYFITSFPHTATYHDITDKELTHRLVRVLKIGIGETIVLCDGNGFEAEACIEAASMQSVRVQLRNVRPSTHELPYTVRLCVAMVKRDVYETVVKQATELGVHHIVPIISERTIKTSLSHTRLQKIIREAAEQSERGFLPVLHPPVPFKKSFDTISSLVFFFDRSGMSVQLHVSKNDKSSSVVTIYIGPEGGWTNQEIEYARSREAIVLSLGQTVFRTDTAVVAGMVATRWLH